MWRRRKDGSVITRELAVAYLANVVSVARSDDRLDPDELAGVEVVRKRFDVEPGDVEKALRMASRRGFRTSPVGRFSDRVANLEDMVYVAMKDGELAGAEKELIRGFAEAIGMTREQLKTIAAETRAKIGLEGSRSPRCGRCREPLENDARFCSACGHPAAPAKPS
jgi:uncharacterized tellurite resistance protein B-like protein